MNEPIISPWLIYFISRLDVVIPILAGVGVFSTATWAAVLLHRLLDNTEFKEFKVFFYPTLIISIVSVTLGIALPDKKTAIAMLVSSKTTPNNVEKMLTESGELKDTLKSDIIDIIKAFNSEGEKKNENE